MRTLFSGKIWIVLLALVSLTGLIVLASGLGGMKFDQPSLGVLENLFGPANIPSRDMPSASWFRSVLIGMFVLLFLLMLGPIRPQTSKNLIMQLVRFWAFTFVLALVVGRIFQSSSLFNGDDASSNPASGAANAETFSAPEVSPQWEFWITSVIVIVLGLLAIVFFNRLVDRWFQPKSSLDELANIARTTLSDLSNTKESRNAIIRCYTRMNATVNKHRGIEREVAMTPSEFAGHLEKQGLPADAVHGLTRVFEKVRYGGQIASTDEIEEAKNHLTCIVEACEIQK